MSLPYFKYHPDPVKTGSIVESDNYCVCCGKIRGYVYVGHVYADEEYDECICPWCIADGSANRIFDVIFTCIGDIGHLGEGCRVPEEVLEEVAYRTPGFSGWQQEQWWTHCNDAAQFIGAMGHKELLLLGEQAIAAIREDTGLPEGPEWATFFAALDKDGSPRAYLFRCTKCGKFGGYQDCD